MTVETMAAAASPDPATSWNLAMAAAAVLALAPEAAGGIRLRAPAGPVRDCWLEGLRGLLPHAMPLRRLPATTGDGRLLGGLDLAATLQAGHPVAERGLLAEVDGGIVLLAMAERVTPSMAARISAVMDRGAVATERDGITLTSPARFGCVALDEGLEDEPEPPLALKERLAMVIDLRALSHRDTSPFAHDAASIAAARVLLPDVSASDEMLTAFCTAALALGIASLRSPLQALQVARALAALAGRATVDGEDAALAAALVLAPRATQLPTATPPEQDAEQQEQQKQDNPEPETAEPDQPETGQQDNQTPPPQNDSASHANEPQTQQAPPDDLVLDAAMAAIPAGLLAQLKLAAGATSASGPSRSGGRAGAFRKAATRGRVIGAKAGDVRGNARLDVVETLRAAAPWQLLRRRDALQRGTELIPALSQAVHVRRADFRVSRFKQRTETTTIFVVDASGSSAMQRLAEAKGAVRLLLADCYIRRDEVALISFRGTVADIVLPPTRALVRAQRALAALPGGGGSPIATAIDAAAALADSVRRAGRSPTIVLMTDGRANIARNGAGGRPQAQEEARQAARALRQQALPVILIDTSPKPQALAAELAVLMQARYVALPHADARLVADAVNAARSPTSSGRAA